MVRAVASLWTRGICLVILLWNAAGECPLAKECPHQWSWDFSIGNRRRLDDVHWAPNPAEYNKFVCPKLASLSIMVPQVRFTSVPVFMLWFNHSLAQGLTPDRLLDNFLFYVGGHLGDLISVLPVVRYLAAFTGVTLPVGASSYTAGLLTGCSYARPVVAPHGELTWHGVSSNWAFLTMGEYAKLHYRHMIDGTAGLVSKLPAKVPGGRGVKKETAGGGTKGFSPSCSLVKENWLAMGVGGLFDDFSTAPLVFDRRNSEREAAYIAAALRTVQYADRPLLLINLRAVTAPFPNVEAAEERLQFMARSVEPFSRFHLVLLSDLPRADYMYDLLGLMDVSSVFITVDTGTAHLSCASPNLSIFVIGANEAAQPYVRCPTADQLTFADFDRWVRNSNGTLHKRMREVLAEVPAVQLPSRVQEILAQAPTPPMAGEGAAPPPAGTAPGGVWPARSARRLLSFGLEDTLPARAARNADRQEQSSAGRGPSSAEVLETIRNIRGSVLVVGDAALDVYYDGVRSGESLETGVPIVNYGRRDTSPGAAGNVACNFARLGLRTSLVARVGRDAAGRDLLDGLRRCGVTFLGTASPTSQTWLYGKVRVAPVPGGGRSGGPPEELFRLDHSPDDHSPDAVPLAVSPELQDDPCRWVAATAPDYVVLVDQLAQLMGRSTVRAFRRCCAEHGCKLAWMSRDRLALGALGPVDFYFGNEHEYGVDHHDVELGLCGGGGRTACTLDRLPSTLEALLPASSHAVLFVTRGAHGASAVRRSARDGRFRVTEVPSRLPAGKTVVDVTGAGDSTLAAVIASLGGNASILQALRVGVLAGGVSVSRDRCVPVSAGDLLAAEMGVTPRSATASEMALPTGRASREDWEAVATLQDVLSLRDRAPGGSVVFVNGVFDLLHAGHVSMLEYASQLGDVLLVAINSDASTRRLKGEARPYIPQAERRYMLLALRAVDAVIIFNEDNVVNILRGLHPEVVVKGADYTIRTISQVELAVVSGYGGRVVFSPPAFDVHTSQIEGKVLSHI